MNIRYQVSTKMLSWRIVEDCKDYYEVQYYIHDVGSNAYYLERYSSGLGWHVYRTYYNLTTINYISMTFIDVYIRSLEFILSSNQSQLRAVSREDI